MRAALAAGLLVLLAVPAYAQEPPEPEAPRIVAAAWCPVRSEDEPEEDDPGCDVGVGAALLRHGRAALVGAIGTETVGLGGAWVAHSGEQLTVAVAVGVVAPYDGDGLRADRASLAVGATFGISPRGAP